MEIIALTDIDLLIDLAALLKTRANLTLGAILEYWRDHPYLEKLAILSAKEPLLSAEELKNELISIMQKLRDHAKEQKIKILMDKAATAQLTAEEKKQLQNEILNSKP